jgi:hypothetical protein
VSELIVACVLWDANEHSFEFSTAYDESWVEKLYCGFRRNLTRPFRFVCFTDRKRDFRYPAIEQEAIEAPFGYWSMMEPFRLNAPMILVGLDTIVTGNCDEMADYCFYGDRIAVPRDPIHPEKVCNGVMLVPAGQKALLYDRFPRGGNDMLWIREQEVAIIDDLFPGQCRSFRIHVRTQGLKDTRLVYFHGKMKPHELPHVGWVDRFWVLD